MDYSDLKVALINAPYLDVYGRINVGKNSSFPLGLGYMASVLKQRDIDVKIFDPEAEGKNYQALQEDIVEYSPTLVGITSATANFSGALKIVQLIRDSAPHMLTMIGGIHASALREKLFELYPDAFDLLCYGEGEYTLLEVVEALQGSQDFSRIKGLIYQENGVVIANPPREFLQNLDELPVPARELVDLDNYRVQPQFYRGCKSATMITSRGCPFGCTFCASELTLGSKFRMHSAEYVLQEIDLLVREYGVKHLVFVDDCFTVNKKRLKTICQEIIEREYHISWHCFARVDTVNEELLKVMRQAGCFSLLFGIESGNDDILKNVHKKLTLSQAEETLRIANRLGFKTVCGFIIGLPGETKDTIQDTINFAKKLNPTIASFNFLIPFPGTEIYNESYKEQLDCITDWDIYNPKPKTPLCVLPNVSQKQLQQLISKAYIQFYARPTQWIRILRHVKNMREVFSLFRGGIGLMNKVREWITLRNEATK